MEFRFRFRNTHSVLPTRKNPKETKPGPFDHFAVSLCDVSSDQSGPGGGLQTTSGILAASLNSLR